METSKAVGERSTKNKMKEEVGSEEEEDEEDNVGLGFGEAGKQKNQSTLSSKKVSGGGGSTQPCCQVENCTNDMTDAKRYHRRHKVCEIHAKATAVVVAGLRQRFCQQCSRCTLCRFHELLEFDEAKRSCRRRLAGHNARRRRSSYDSHGEGSS